MDFTTPYAERYRRLARCVHFGFGTPAFLHAVAGELAEILLCETGEVRTMLEAEVALLLLAEEDPPPSSVLSWKALPRPHMDMQYRVLLEEQLAVICRVFAVEPEVLGFPDFGKSP